MTLGAQYIDPVVWTTEPKTANGRANRWLKLYPDRSVPQQTHDYWVYTDGSSTGACAAVIVPPDGRIYGVSEFRQPDSTRNVGSELSAVWLGLSRIPDNQTVTVVSDYLGTFAWLSGQWRITDQSVRQRIDTIEQLVAANQLRLRLIHMGGHARDDSHFTVFNDWADKLCSGTGAARKRLPLVGLRVGWDWVEERQQYLRRQEAKRQALAANRVKKLSEAKP